MTQQPPADRSMAPPPSVALPPAGDARRPRVIWDMTFTARNLTGTRVYAHNLYQTLAASGSWDVQEIYGTRTGARGEHSRWRANAQNVWWLLRGAGRRVNSCHADLFHAAAYLGPRHLPCPLILNVFDTTYLAFPNDFDWRWHVYARTVIPSAIRNAAALLTLSEHARGEIVRAYQIAPERVNVVYPGVGGEFRPISDPSALAAMRARYDVGENYLLYGGAAHPRKNVSAIIGAFARVRQEFPDLTLTLFGPGTPASSEIQDALRANGVALATRLLDFVPLTDLPALYSGARAFVYASKLEGFGIPPVEAMACGVPVIAAPNPPMPEVLGDAAWFTENDSPESLARGIRHVLEDAALTATLRQRGLERACRYTWAQAADKTITIYNSVLAHSRRNGQS